MTAKRDPKIAKRLRRGEPAAAVADRYDLTTRRIRQIGADAGIPPSTRGRRPTGAATHHTARGRALLARLVDDARAVGIEPEVYLGRARSWLTAERDDLERQRDADSEVEP